MGRSAAVNAPVLVGVDGAQNQILRPGNFFQVFRFAAVHKVVRTQRARFFFLAGRRGKSRDFRAEGPRELDCQVAQAADADQPTREDGLTPWVAQRL